MDKNKKHIFGVETHKMPDQIKRYDVQIFFQKIISEFSAYEFSIA